MLKVAIETSSEVPCRTKLEVEMDAIELDCMALGDNTLPPG